MQRFSVGKSASVLACIALLAAGFSLGCTSSSSSAADGGSDAATTPLADTSRPVDTAPSPTPDTAPITAQDTAPSPTPDTAPITAQDAAPSPTPDAEPGEAGDGSTSPADATNERVPRSPDALMDLFRDGTPEDIAARLEASVADAPADRQVDKPMVLYKGVTFPTEKTA